MRADPADRRFLTTLVWPGEGAGRAHRGGLDIVAAEPPVLIAGDATDPAVLARAARCATRGDARRHHPGVLPHIPREGRERLFAALEALRGGVDHDRPAALHDRWHPAVDAATWGGSCSAWTAPLAAVDPLGAFVEWRAGGERWGRG